MSKAKMAPADAKLVQPRRDDLLPSEMDSKNGADVSPQGASANHFSEMFFFNVHM
jgi:hypothetical protein